MAHTFSSLAVKFLPLQPLGLTDTGHVVTLTKSLGSSLVPSDCCRNAHLALSGGGAP